MLHKALMETTVPTVGLSIMSATSAARQAMGGVHAQACLNNTDQHPRQGVALAGVEAEAWQASIYSSVCTSQSHD